MTNRPLSVGRPGVPKDLNSGQPNKLEAFAQVLQALQETAGHTPRGDAITSQHAPDPVAGSGILYPDL